jgi:hypothetical protein
MSTQLDQLKRDCERSDLPLRRLLAERDALLAALRNLLANPTYESRLDAAAAIAKATEVQS